jgi:hypothetical protein
MITAVTIPPIIPPTAPFSVVTTAVCIITSDGSGTIVPLGSSEITDPGTVFLFF